MELKEFKLFNDSKHECKNKLLLGDQKQGNKGGCATFGVVFLIAGKDQKCIIE